MNPNTYQKEAHEFATYGSNEMYPILGLAEESGEVLGKIAKFIRKHDGVSPLTATELVAMKDDYEEFKNALTKELGDVCWMLAEICTVYGIDFEEVMEENISKLTDRKNRGVIVGEGDNR